MHFNQKTAIQIAQYITACFLVLFMVGCDTKMPHEEGYVPRVKVVELKEIGSCKDEQGTLFRVNYVGFNTLMFFSKFIYFVKPDMGKFCIPDLDQSKRHTLSKAEKQKLDAGFFNTVHLANAVETVKDAEGNVSYQRVGLKRLQDQVRMGSELAYLDLHLFDYKDTGREFKYSEDNPYYQRLKHLAKSGDAEAMCLFSRKIPTPFKGYEHLKLNQQETLTPEDRKKLILKRFEEGPEDKWTKGMINAAKAGASDCMYSYGFSLLKGELPNQLEFNSESNTQEGMKYMIKAAKNGNAGVAKHLAIQYILGPQGGNNFVEYDLGKYKCWAQVYNQSFPDVYKPILFEEKIKREQFSKGTLNFTEYDPLTLCQTIKE